MRLVNSPLLHVFLIILAFHPASPLSLPEGFAVEEPGRRYAAFKELGSTVPSQGYVHMHLEVDLDQASKQLDDLILAAGHAWHDDSPAKDAFQRTLTRAAIDLAHHRGTTTAGPKHRFRRTPLLAIAVGLGAMIWGATNTVMIKALDTRVGALEQKVDGQSIRINRNTEAINEVKVITTRIANNLATFEERTLAQQLIMIAGNEAIQNVNDINEVIQAAYMGRLSVRLLDEGKLTDELEQAHEKADALGYELLIAHPSDVYLCQGRFTPTTTGFAVEIRLPIAKKGDRFTLYQAISIPIAATSDSFIHIKPEHHYLAVSQDGSRFQPLTDIQLATCNHMGSLYMCENNNVALNVDSKTLRDDKLCIIHIWGKDYEAIKANCPIHVSPATDDTVDLGDNKFLLTNRVNHQGALTCAQDPQTYPFNADKITIVTVPPGCQAKTNSYTATGAIGVDLAPVGHAYEWPADDFSKILETVTIAELEEIHKIAADANQLKSLPTTVDEIALWKADRDASNFNAALMYAAWGLIGICALGATALCIWTCYRQRHNGITFSSIAEQIRRITLDVATAMSTPSAPPTDHLPAYDDLERQTDVTPIIRRPNPVYRETVFDDVNSAPWRARSLNHAERRRITVEAVHL
jgi:Baculovirus F protein